MGWEFRVFFPLAPAVGGTPPFSIATVAGVTGGRSVEERTDVYWAHSSDVGLKVAGRLWGDRLEAKICTGRRPSGLEKWKKHTTSVGDARAAAAYLASLGVDPAATAATFGKAGPTQISVDKARKSYSLARHGDVVIEQTDLEVKIGAAGATQHWRTVAVEGSTAEGIETALALFIPILPPGARPGGYPTFVCGLLGREDAAAACSDPEGK